MFTSGATKKGLRGVPTPGQRAVCSLHLKLFTVCDICNRSPAAIPAHNMGGYVCRLGGREGGRGMESGTSLCSLRAPPMASSEDAHDVPFRGQSLAIRRLAVHPNPCTRPRVHAFGRTRGPRACPRLLALDVLRSYGLTVDFRRKILSSTDPPWRLPFTYSAGHVIISTNAFSIGAAEPWGHKRTRLPHRSPLYTTLKPSCDASNCSSITQVRKICFPYCTVLILRVLRAQFTTFWNASPGHATTAALFRHTSFPFGRPPTPTSSY